MSGKINLSNSWQDSFNSMNLQENEPITLSPEAVSSNDHQFQHRINHRDDKNIKDAFYTTLESPITLRYRDSIGSNASSLSRNSTVSSTDTRYFTAKGVPSELNTPVVTPIRIQSWNPSNHSDYLSNASASTSTSSLEKTTCLSPMQLQSPHHQTPYMPSVESYQPQGSPGYYSVVEPNGCFVPTKPLSFIQKTDINRHHYVIPTFAMAGQSQADVMKLIFNYSDRQPFAPKEELERTISWQIDRNSSLITLSQYTSLGQDNPVSHNYLLGLGQRLGINTILVILSIEAIDTVYTLLNNLVKSMEPSTTNTNNPVQEDQPSWWSRVVLVVNQRHGVSDQTAYAQRKSVLVDQMPRIQERYRLSHPLSIIFVSTQVYDQIKNTEQGAQYKTSCQRILWQMMDRHMLSGRWCSEQSTLQNRLYNPKNSNTNFDGLDEENGSSSSSDEATFTTVIDIVNGKVSKPIKKKKKQHNTRETSGLQRRNTRRPTQKLHCHDGDDGTELPLPVRHI